jgi:branched-chain amino acid transport system permease protein
MARCSGIGESLSLPRETNNLFGLALTGNNDFNFYWIIIVLLWS